MKLLPTNAEEAKSLGVTVTLDTALLTMLILGLLGQVDLALNAALFFLWFGAGLRVFAACALVWWIKRGESLPPAKPAPCGLLVGWNIATDALFVGLLAAYGRFVLAAAVFIVSIAARVFRKALAIQEPTNAPAL